ncbi:MAG: tetratricopeptide repeat protein [Myxococcota bacterium]
MKTISDAPVETSKMVPSGAATWHLCDVSDYSLGDVARILKVSPRRLRYWQQTQLVEALSREGDSASASESQTASATSAAKAKQPDERKSDQSESGHAGDEEATSLEAPASSYSASSSASSQGSTPGSTEGDDQFAFRDLVVLRAIVALLDKGIPLQRIRRNLETVRDRIPEMDDPAAALRLWDEDPRRIVVRHDGRLEEAGGQLFLEFDADPAGQPVASLAEHDAAKVISPFDAESPADEAIAWFERGCALDADSEKSEEATEAYERALELDPHFADAYCNLGAVRYNQGRLGEARRAFEACLDYEADHVEANFNLANVLEEAGEDDSALAHYRRALASDPHYPDLHINLALLYEKLDRMLGATQHWRRYLKLDPQGSWAEVARQRLDRASDKM